MKVEFTNNQGQIVFLDDKLTLEDLVKMGIELKLEPSEKPKLKDPKWFYHDPQDVKGWSK